MGVKRVFRLRLGLGRVARQNGNATTGPDGAAVPAMMRMNGIIDEGVIGTEAKATMLLSSHLLVRLPGGVVGIQDTGRENEITEVAPRAQGSTTATRIERESLVETQRRSVDGRRIVRKDGTVTPAKCCQIPLTKIEIRTRVFSKRTISIPLLHYLPRE